jgi:TRAP-type C4-dicarboxylate transport system substrate-binding protein
MKLYQISIGLLLFFVLLIANPWNEVLGQRGGGRHGKGFLSNLTDEQRETVREKMEEMREKGATPEEIHTTMAEMLKEYGIEVPEDLERPHGPGGPGPGGFWKDLTEEQREAVQEKMKEMRDQGATPEEIHTAMAEMLKGYGIEVPEDLERPHGPGPGGFWKDLTEEQRQAVQEKMKEMRDQDATPEEIHTAMAEMLKGYGIEVPEDLGRPHGPGPGGFWEDLTEEQRQAVREKMKELRDQDAAREEIHTAMAEMLKGYGIEVPEDLGRPHGPGPGGFWEDLTEEQRQAVREEIKEMRSQGATREEIRDAVDEMISGFGIELSKDSESTSSEKVSAEPYIQAQNYPNPFNPQTEIAYSLPEDSEVKLTILNIQGQKVRVLVDEYQTAGTKKVIWDGCDKGGERVASGVYFYRIEAGPYHVTNRMVLLK